MARLRLQIHLSTCVALVFVAGGLLWANVATRQGFFHGFPYIAISDNQFDGEVSETWSEYMNESPPQNVIQWGTGLTVLPARLALNCLAGIMILALTAFMCEQRFRSDNYR